MKKLLALVLSHDDGICLSGAISASAEGEVIERNVRRRHS